MTIKELKKIIAHLPEETILVANEDDVKTILVEYHNDGRTYFILSNCE